MKTLWIVSGGAEAVPGIQLAKMMGLYVVVSDGSSQAPGRTFADDFVQVSTYDVKKTVDAALRYNQTVRTLDGIICIAADVPLTVASISEKLGLPGIPIAAAKLAADKLAMKNCFAEAALPIPWFCQVESVNHLRKLVKKKGYPIVIKPVDSRGARGVLRLTSGINIEWAFQHALSFSPTQRVMIEEYLEGPQISTESLMLDGRGFTPGFADRNYEFLEQFAPYIIENGGEQPSALSKKQQKAVKDCAEQAALAMGIKSGVAKGDLVLTKSGPKVIEMAARLSGGWFCTDQIPIGTGVDLVGAAIRLALGEAVSSDDLIPHFNKGVAIRYFFPPHGKVLAIEGAESFKKKSWVHRIGFFVAPGDTIGTATDHTQRAGFVITIGKTRKQAVNRAQKVIETVRIMTSYKK